MTIAPERVDVSRRRVLQGAAWATPAVLIATAAPAFAASTTPVANPLQSTSVTSVTRVNNQQVVTVSLAIPAGVVLTGVTLSVAWVKAGGNNTGVTVSGGGLTWSGVSTATPANFTSTGTLSGSKTITVSIDKPAAQTGNDFTITIMGTQSGSASPSSVVIGGEYV